MSVKDNIPKQEKKTEISASQHNKLMAALRVLVSHTHTFTDDYGANCNCNCNCSRGIV